MKIVINHLTRMEEGFICVAGIDLATGKHVRPLPRRGRLTTAHLVRNGGPFDIGRIVDLGPTRPIGQPPELEDQQFDPRQAHCVGAMPPDRFWRLLQTVCRPRLTDVFGPALRQQGQSCVVSLNCGTASLGCIARPPSALPRVNTYGKLRTHLTDGTHDAWASVTDLRLCHDDHKTPRAVTIQCVQKQLANGVGAILCVGLTRAFRRTEDTPAVHYLQVNNIHLENNPVWEEASIDITLQ